MVAGLITGPKCTTEKIDLQDDLISSIGCLARERFSICDQVSSSPVTRLSAGTETQLGHGVRHAAVSWAHSRYGPLRRDCEASSSTIASSSSGTPAASISSRSLETRMCLARNVVSMSVPSTEGEEPFLRVGSVPIRRHGPPGLPARKDPGSDLPERPVCASEGRFRGGRSRTAGRSVRPCSGVPAQSLNCYWKNTYGR